MQGHLRPSRAPTGAQDHIRTNELAAHPALRLPSVAVGRDDRQLATTPRVSVVIPALNEAENLPHVLTALPSGLHEVVLVDGHSTDETVAVARQLRPDVKIITQSGVGKGNALASGFAACEGDIIVTIDADGSADAAEIPRFVAVLLNGADVATGSRFLQGSGSADITRVRRWGNLLLKMFANCLFGTRYTDLCYGYNAFWSWCLENISFNCEGFEVETLLHIRAVEAGLVVHEVPSYEHRRIHGASNLRVVRDGWRVLQTILAERFKSPSVHQPAASWSKS